MAFETWHCEGDMQLLSKGSIGSTFEGKYQDFPGLRGLGLQARVTLERSGKGSIDQRKVILLAHPKP